MTEVEELRSMSAAEYARDAARDLDAHFTEEGVLRTANYRLCSFAIAAVDLALADAEVARRIGEMMEPPYITGRDGGVGDPRRRRRSTASE